MKEQRGYCVACGVGFAPYVECSRSDCRWIDDQIGNPSPDFSTLRIDAACRAEKDSGPTWEPLPSRPEAPKVKAGDIGPSW